MKQKNQSSEALLRISRSPALRGRVSVPGDKSISHRALLFGALADGAVEISGLGLGGDNASTMAALRALGVPIQQAGTEVRVEGVGLAGLRASGLRSGLREFGHHHASLLWAFGGPAVRVHADRRRVAVSPTNGPGGDALATHGRGH